MLRLRPPQFDIKRRSNVISALRFRKSREGVALALLLGALAGCGGHGANVDATINADTGRQATVDAFDGHLKTMARQTATAKRQATARAAVKLTANPSRP